VRRIESPDVDSIVKYFDSAAELARQATCLRAKCGSIIVAKSGIIIGRGFNAPPRNDEGQRRCEVDINTSSKPKYDKTCCVHAEWNAVIDALQQNAEYISGSRLYFMRVDDNGQFTNAGEPYCTTCSRFTMQAGVAEFALWNDNGADVYTLPEYNDLSYRYYE
jgi:deoxycytidylate deaminase